MSKLNQIIRVGAAITGVVILVSVVTFAGTHKVTRYVTMICAPGQSTCVQGETVWNTMEECQALVEMAKKSQPEVQRMCIKKEY